LQPTDNTRTEVSQPFRANLAAASWVAPSMMFRASTSQIRHLTVGPRKLLFYLIDGHWSLKKYLTSQIGER
jgi:hypothetical protein